MTVAARGRARGFDPDLAGHPTRELPVVEVVDLLEVTHAAERIREYRERMRAGDLFPPVSVVRLFGRWLVADGHKRYAAWRGLGATRVVVEVWPFRTWLADQAGQAGRNARKNGRILARLFVDPRESALLARATTGHWRRVALSLAQRALRRGEPPESLATLLSPSPDGPASTAVREESAAAALARFAWSAVRDDPAASHEDVYKWLFQAARGGEHAAPSEEAARTWLRREWATLGAAAPGEPLVVPLRPDGRVVRLNLRPYRAAGGDPEALLAAFLESARSFRPDPALFVEAWRELLKSLPASLHGTMSLVAFEELDRASEAGQWPARHHSPGYAEVHAPAYRVLTDEEAGKLVRELGERR